MEYEYQPPNLRNHYEDEKWLRKKFDDAIAEGMMKFLGAVIDAENAYDIKSIRQFFMEHKHNNLKEYYAVSLDKKKSKWRLMLQMLDDSGNVMLPTENEVLFLKSIRKIRIKEISDYYAKY